MSSSPLRPGGGRTRTAAARKRRASIITWSSPWTPPPWESWRRMEAGRSGRTKAKKIPLTAWPGMQEGDVMTPKEQSRPINLQVRIGHVHLKVADLEGALRFYCGVLGFELTQRYGAQAAFVSAGGYHHHIGLNTWESQGGLPPPPGTTGLYHVA